ncbi:hypothetical protein EV702DRAFT_1093173 [Suillus placidus]|uniref:Uncharacterized protein n=1 Tax=Suillus placidus TaxID=48579 RepID=A0A9P6ZY43_9AGAM|nr:hypothetical protein EV702DRAFT_1093173 [Suillus placidus]
MRNKPKSCSILNSLINEPDMDGSDVGLFGTLRPMKRTTDEQLAAFQINEETLTFNFKLKFGRDTATCNVRLYGDPEMNALDAEIVLQAFNPRLLTKHTSLSTAVNGAKAELWRTRAANIIPICLADRCCCASGVRTQVIALSIIVQYVGVIGGATAQPLDVTTTGTETYARCPSQNKA